MKPLVLFVAVVGALVSSPAARAQGPTPALIRCDSVRVFLAGETPGAPRLLGGRILTVGADSLGLDGRGIAWVDVVRLERLGQNRRQEWTGVLVGAFIGAGVGWLVGEIDGRWLASPAYALVVGLLVGPAVGATVGARSNRPWEEVPLAGPPVGVRAVARF